MNNVCNDLERFSMVFSDEYGTEVCYTATFKNVTDQHPRQMSWSSIEEMPDEIYNFVSDHMTITEESKYMRVLERKDKFYANMLTNKAIYDIIKEHNKNRDIHWKITKNNSFNITIVNDYCGSCKFTIDVKDEGETVVLTDEGRDARTLWLIGDESWHDCKTVDEAIKRSIKAAVDNFYYYY